MKILILGFTKMKFMPYINFYLSNLSKKHEVHIIYWNRDLKREDLSSFHGIVLHEFICKQEDDAPKLSKIKSFYKYRTFAKKIIKNHLFDKLIVLHTLPGVVLCDKLKKYHQNYILDYRDSTYEFIPLFRKIIALLVKWSEVTFVSSDAFRKYLPVKYRQKILTSHNILEDSLSHQNDREKYYVPSDKIRLAFWGFIRHEEINIKLIEKLSNDPRFELHYYGREQQIAYNLKSYVKESGARNIFFHGEYKPEDRYEFIKHTDCIHNLYYDNNTMLAMGNKYYDGIIFQIPQVCMKGSFMGHMCTKHNVGVELNPFLDSFADKLYSYLINLNYNKFKINCKKELDRVLFEFENGKKVLDSIFEKH